MKVPIRFEVVMMYEVVGNPYEGEDAEGLRWHIEENHCAQNVAAALDALLECEPEGTCSLCAFAKVTILPKGTEALDCVGPELREAVNREDAATRGAAR